MVVTSPERALDDGDEIIDINVVMSDRMPEGMEDWYRARVGRRWWEDWSRVGRVGQRGLIIGIQPQQPRLIIGRRRKRLRHGFERMHRERLADGPIVGDVGNSLGGSAEGGWRFHPTHW